MPRMEGGEASSARELPCLTGRVKADPHSVLPCRLQDNYAEPLKSRNSGYMVGMRGFLMAGFFLFSI